MCNGRSREEYLDTLHIILMLNFHIFKYFVMKISMKLFLKDKHLIKVKKVDNLQIMIRMVRMIRIIKMIRKEKIRMIKIKIRIRIKIKKKIKIKNWR